LSAHAASAQVSLRRALLPAALLALALSAVGCGGKKQTARNVPPAPSLPIHTSAPRAKAKTQSNPAARDLGPLASVPGIHVDPNARVLWSEVGYASWYGPNYHNKKASNGELYNQNEMTAAHNTLPLNSIVRVVNLGSNRSTVVRITDRGPFVGDRIIDLSVAAAKALDIYLPGTAEVRLDVLEAPHPIETGGRWCVQIGAFQSQADASALKQRLLDRYPGSQVLQFKGPTGYWVRIRVARDEKEMTRNIYEHTHVEEGGVFLVRLD
jgi:rare lipoprotein A